ncbi:MAG TPA: phosphoribosyltransferase [Candidatus Saccharimonadia bacterium]|nr:phosphoribosyltransferase [Candidatus Saccharimonadia bacterium]
MLFRDRIDAGLQLAHRLSEYAGRADVVVVGLPRGGVPVAAEVAKSLRAPLDIMVVRKLGVPGHEELALGAIAPNDALVVNPGVMARLQDPEEALREAIERESKELQRREQEYQAARPALDLKGKMVIVVDDGLATGATMHAAVQALKHHAVAECVVAVPVTATDARRSFEDKGVEVISLLEPEEFRAVGEHYDDFTQTTDQEVLQRLHEAASSTDSL